MDRPCGEFASAHQRRPEIRLRDALGCHRAFQHHHIKAALLAGNYSADERMAAFLISLSRRYAERGFSATRIGLAMARTDIANYLRLAPETVSRVFRRFQDEKLLHVDRREIDLVDRARLEALARDVLRG